jgi:hypothetical protein
VFKSPWSQYFFKNANVIFWEAHTSAFAQRPRVDPGKVHACTSARSMCEDLSNLFHKCPFLAASTSGHLRSPRVDIDFQQGCWRSV